MKFDSIGRIEEVVWDSRIADMPRGENRNILNRCFNGEPPYDPETAEEEGINVNRNFLHGTRKLTEARAQWNRAMLANGNYFNVRLDSGPKHKRADWGRKITHHINKSLKRNPRMSSQIRATGASVLLHGIGPVVWKDQEFPVPKEIPIPSLIIASETDIDMENLEWTAFFREWTPSQLYKMTHGIKVDPGWNMKAVKDKLFEVAQETQKQPNATAYQYMPERIEELIKQDLGYWGSDAVPTVDCWDFYFREDDDDGNGWYRRIFLDWGAESKEYVRGSSPPQDKNKNGFLYSSGDTKYADFLSNILHVQSGDCSCVAPFKYHSVRALGWMMWGICDLLNRYHCRVTEAQFEQLLWFFKVAGEEQMGRIKKAMFSNMGVIPNGVEFVKAQDRFQYDLPSVQFGFAKMEQMLNENSAAFSSEGDRLGGDKERTATETMALVNSTSSLTSGVLTLAYEQAIPQYREISRRYCIENSKYKSVRDFRVACLQDDIPPEMLDVERWEIEPERIMGGGSKTVQLAQTNGLISIRKFLNPAGQRYVDHVALETFTDDPGVAEEYASLDEEKHITNSTHDAQQSTDRLMLGLPFDAMPSMIYEDYVAQWIRDLEAMLTVATKLGNMSDIREVLGWRNMVMHIGKFMAVLAQDDENKPRVKIYKDKLTQLENLIKGFAQRAAEQMQAGGGNGTAKVDAETQAKLKGKMLIDKAKADNMRESHAARTAQKQAQWELDQQRKEREHRHGMRQENVKLVHELAINRAKSLQHALEPKPAASDE